ncbi:MAG TPA: FlgD immunoglobulin-like domain containing protein, partial [Candidatus Eisenbacteria bacterium]
DNNVVYGRVMADNVLYFPGDSKRLIAIDHQPGLENGDYIEYEIQVTSNSFPLEVTLCWTDYPASPASSIQLVNDLNLTVSNGATVYKGNVYSAGASIAGGSFDNRNVEEACLIGNPALGTWTVRVEGFAVPVGPQPFGLVVTGVVDGGAGALYLDKAEYGSTGTVGVKVIDTNATSPLTVHITSPSEPGGEDVTLTGANGVLTGTLKLAPWSPGAPHGAGHLSSLGRDALGTLGVDVADDTLRVAHGDQLTATYLDANPVATLTARAFVAIEQPTITSVSADSRGSSAAVINWTTNLNSDSRVYYGLTPALELGSLFQADQVLAHQILIPGLTTSATYYYDVESVGPNGNLVRDNNGGDHYRVTIDPPADILLVIGDEASFDRLEAWTEAAAAAGWSLDIWSGTLADNAQLGNTTGGLRSYKAVIWQPGFSQYPPFSDTQRTTIGNYLNGGGRLLAVGHDIAWAFGDVGSPVYSIARRDWLRDVLHTTWQEDPATWSSNIGYASDPISGAYTGGVPYTPLGSTQAGDEVDVFLGNGTSNYVWRSNATTPDDIGFRWLSNVNNGSPDSAVWGGAPSRLATMYFEYTAITPPFGTPTATRTDILDKTLIWLIGRDQPAIAVTAPTVASTVTTDSVDVTWSEVISGASAANRKIEYSADGGDSWILVANGVGPSPYRWGLNALPNRTTMRVRVTVTDNGTPALTGSGAMSGNFSLQRPSADAEGPLVVPGSPVASPNPYTAGMAATLAARLTDAARGGLNVTAAEWSYGPAAATAGSGTAMTGVFTTPTVDVSASIPTRTINPGPTQFWVRGRDSAGNWGAATALQVQVNPGMFAQAEVLCAADTALCPGDTLNLSLQVVNVGPGADTLHVELVDQGPGPGLTLVGGPVVITTSVAAGDTLVVPYTVVTASNAADAASTVLKARAWPTDFPSDADSCLTLITVMAPVVGASCPSDTLVISPDTVPLAFSIANTGSKPDSIRWTITDLGPGPDIVMQGGPSISGVSYLGGNGPTSDNLPAVTVEAFVAAAPGQTATLQLVTWPDSDPSLADTCDVTVGISMASAVPEGGIPLVFAAGPAHPNPFTATARISFTLPATGHAAIRIHSADGRLVRTLVDGTMEAGPHLVDWDGRDGDGTAVPSGVYFYRLTGDGGQVAGGRVLRVR